MTVDQQSRDEELIERLNARIKEINRLTAPLIEHELHGALVALKTAVYHARTLEARNENLAAEVASLKERLKLAHQGITRWRER